MMKIFGILVVSMIVCGCSSGSGDHKEELKKNQSSEETVNAHENNNTEINNEMTIDGNLFDFQIEDINGEAYDLSQHKGKKILLVNTASECGLTPQYEQLEALYQEKGGDDFVIVGFPANNFGGQEPGTNQEIAQFCSKNYGVSFPMMSKISVKGSDIHPIYNWIVETERTQSGQSDFEIMWNFHKVLIDENGNYVKQLHPQVLPTDEPVLSWIDGE